MEYQFAVDLLDKDGDAYEDGVFAFCGNRTILRFINTSELEQFAKKIIKSIPEIRETYPNR